MWPTPICLVKACWYLSSLYDILPDFSRQSLLPPLYHFRLLCKFLLLHLAHWNVMFGLHIPLPSLLDCEFLEARIHVYLLISSYKHRRWHIAAHSNWWTKWSQKENALVFQIKRSPSCHLVKLETFKFNIIGNSTITQASQQTLSMPCQAHQNSPSWAFLPKVFEY